MSKARVGPGRRKTQWGVKLSEKVKGKKAFVVSKGQFAGMRRPRPEKLRTGVKDITLKDRRSGNERRSGKDRRGRK